MENKYVNIIALIGVLLISAFFVFRDGAEKKVSNNSGMHRMPDGTMMPNSGVGDMHESMNVSTDEEFIKGMIPHHEEAVATAKEVLARGGSFPEMKTLAENIIASQNIEIEQMKIWHQEWFGAPYTEDGNYILMMRDLSTLSGKDLDKVFLEDMVMHHMGALMMAQQAQEFTEREEIKNLTEAIISAQNKEIVEMREWLGSKF